MIVSPNSNDTIVFVNIKDIIIIIVRINTVIQSVIVVIA
jgi:hypothetical protein